MARDRGALYVPPDPFAFGAGKVHYSADTWKLLKAVNKLNADPGPPPIRQGWHDGQFTAGGADTVRCTYRIPEWSPKHTAVGLTCRVRVRAFGGAGGGIRFRSVNGGGTVTTGAIGAAGWYSAVGALPVGFGAGYEDITVSTLTAVGSLVVDAISCTWSELTDPLPSGANGGATPFDSNEGIDDASTNAALGERLFNTLRAIEERPKVYFSWSGLAGISYGGAPTAADYMQYYRHVAHVPVLQGTESRDWRLTYWIYAGNPAGATEVVIKHGAGRARELGPDTTTVSFGAAAAQWKTGTIRLPEIRTDLPDLARLTSAAHLEFHPQDVGGQNPRIQRVSIWGR